MSAANNQDEQSHSRSAVSFWVMAMIALPILYVLSIGPANWLYEQFEFLEAPLEVIYFPWIAFAESEWFPLVEPYETEYLEWWDEMMSALLMPSPITHP